METYDWALSLPNAKPTARKQPVRAHDHAMSEGKDSARWAKKTAGARRRVSGDIVGQPRRRKRRTFQEGQGTAGG